MSRRLPVVAVVGRPNVGKSTLFNRVLGERTAIVDNRPGVTRDRNFAQADWAGHEFFIVDTGGVIEGSDEPMDRHIRSQALTAVEEADLILFVVDGKAGIHPLDERLTEVLRDSGRPVLVVVNKVDNLPGDVAYHEFWGLGLGEPLPVSSISGLGSGDLLDRVVAAFPEDPGEAPADGALKVAVIGKPNAGKSSFVNRLFGEERVVVSEVPGTTRDPVDSRLRYHGRDVIFVDTAGLRRQSRISDSVEYYSSLRTARVIRDAEVCLVMVDAAEGLHQQDLKIMEAAWEAGCGVVVAVNKWDLVDKEDNPTPRIERELRARATLLQFVPITFISALTGQRVRGTLDLILRVAEERRRRIPTHEVNEVMEALFRHQPPPHSRGRPVKLRYATQADTAPPTFVIFSNIPDAIPDHYIRYLHNGFRKAWGFNGVPLRIRIRASTEGRTPA
ncbi:MAG: ribosome biogenesis GTPase Der [Gemmatimonadales bacterium]|nr:MAG: ribosome biogenesis GTPase Der [Gemmatimonadales bacterium]